MRTSNSILDGIRQVIPEETKIQIELSVAIANRIYSILDQRGMSQKEFARLMGKTETEVSRWLSGTHNLTISTISKITVALGEELIRPVTPTVAGYSQQRPIARRYLSDSAPQLCGTEESTGLNKLKKSK